MQSSIWLFSPPEKHAPMYSDFFGVDFGKDISKCRDSGAQLSEGIFLAHCHPQSMKKWGPGSGSQRVILFFFLFQPSKIAMIENDIWCLAKSTFFKKNQIKLDFFSNVCRFFAFLPGFHMQTPIPAMPASLQSCSSAQLVLVEFKSFPSKSPEEGPRQCLLLLFLLLSRRFLSSKLLLSLQLLQKASWPWWFY